MGDQAEDVIPHNNLRQYTDEQWRRQSRSTKTAVFVLGWITNANCAEMILAWMDKKEWGGAKSHKEDGLTAHEKYEKKRVHSKEKNNRTLLETDVESLKSIKRRYVLFLFADKLVA